MRRTKHSRLRAIAAGLCLSAASLPAAGLRAARGQTAVAPSRSDVGLPATPASFAAAIRTALLQRDAGAMEKLVNWDGASAFKHRWVLFEIRKAFGRKLRSVAAEPFPADALASLAQFGAFKPNMDVKTQIRVVFDEPATQYGSSPDMVFLAGEQNSSYRIALINPITPQPHQ